jgi:hypothetical protein
MVDYYQVKPQHWPKELGIVQLSLCICATRKPPTAAAVLSFYSSFCFTKFQFTFRFSPALFVNCLLSLFRNRIGDDTAFTK